MMHIYAVVIMGKIFSENYNSQKPLSSTFKCQPDTYLAACQYLNSVQSEPLFLNPCKVSFVFLAFYGMQCTETSRFCAQGFKRCLYASWLETSFAFSVGQKYIDKKIAYHSAKETSLCIQTLTCKK